MTYFCNSIPAVLLLCLISLFIFVIVKVRRVFVRPTLTGSRSYKYYTPLPTPTYALYQIRPISFHASKTLFRPSQPSSTCHTTASPTLDYSFGRLQTPHIQLQRTSRNPLHLNIYRYWPLVFVGRLLLRATCHNLPMSQGPLHPAARQQSTIHHY